MRREGPLPERAGAPLTRHLGVEPAAAERLERARLEGALLVARTVAHELNNTLAPVLGYAELLMDRPGVAEDPQALAYASSIARAAAHTAAKIRRLQYLSRLVERPSAYGPDEAVLDLERSTDEAA